MQQAASIKQMNTNRYLFWMSLPILIELVLQLLVGNIDQIMVGRVSQKSVAVIVNGNQVMNLITIIMTTAASATTVVLSCHLGARDRENASRTCILSMLLIGFFSLTATVVIFCFIDPLLHFMNLPEEIFEETKRYLLIVVASSLFQGLYLNYSAILRTFTMMKEVMIVSVIMNVLNIAGNSILINGWLGLPQLGSFGAAVSTVFSKLIGLILMMALFRCKVDLVMELRLLKSSSLKVLKSLCCLAIPASAESLSYNLSQLCILGIINSFGTMATVTKGYCSFVANLSYVYAVAFAQAMQIVLGYLIGAKLEAEIQKRVYDTQKLAVAVCVGMAFTMFLCSPWLLLLFTDDPQVIALGRTILAIEIVLDLGRGINIVMTRTLISLGDIKTPTIAGISMHWAAAFLGAYFFGVILGWGLPGVWIAMALDECTRGLIYVIRFKQEKWRRMFAVVPVQKC